MKFRVERDVLAEAVTWALLLAGMFLKCVTETTELGVRIFGMVHGIVFVAYVLVTLVVVLVVRHRRKQHRARDDGAPSPPAAEGAGL